MRSSLAYHGFNLRLTPRDHEVACALYAHQALSRDHLMGLGFFGSIPRCNNRMHALTAARIARRLPTPIGCAGSQALYGPGIAAVPLIAEHLGLDPREVSASCRVDVAPLFLRHTLAVADVHVAAHHSAKAHCIDLSRFLAERGCCHEYATRVHPSAPWKRHIHRPDAYLEAGTSGERAACFLEIDLGTVSVKQFREKVENSHRYLRSGAFAEGFGSPSFRVLVVTTSDTRLRQLASVADTPEPRFFFTTFAGIADRRFFAAVWRARGFDGLVSPLIEVPA